MSSTTVLENSIEDLLFYFANNTYHASINNKFITDVMDKCINLFQVDYDVITIDNKSGELSSHYPGQLLLLLCEKMPPPYFAASNSRPHNTIYENVIQNKEKLLSYVHNGRLGRCRTRFPFPVIFFRGKYLCRSATLAGGAEIYGRSGLEGVYQMITKSYEAASSYDQEDEAFVSQSEWQLFDKVRSADIKLLNAFNVNTIIDFMVEKKKVKFGFNVTSSEKVDRENRYAGFNLISLPYPGCEHFKDFTKNSYDAEGLHFDWSQTYIDASISVPQDSISRDLGIDWSKYRKWDLERITMNYLKLILKHLDNGNSSVLIHCISGWDRTPLFVSLVRLSLWADGVIHQNLDVYQIIYLTIAYDWMLFGHHLPDRIAKGEDVLFFCFNFLKKIVGEEFAVQPCLEHALRNDPEEYNFYENIIRIKGGKLSSAYSNQDWDNRFSPPHEDANVNGNNCTNGNSPPRNTEPTARSPSAKRASPTCVPATRIRQRHESTSSTSSWYVVSGSGSIRDTESENGFIASSDSSSFTNLSQHSEDSQEFTRKCRLLTVRKIFLKAYHRKVGLKFQNEKSFVKLVDNVAEMVGWAPKN